MVLVKVLASVPFTFTEKVHVPLAAIDPADKTKAVPSVLTDAPPPQLTDGLGESAKTIPEGRLSVTLKLLMARSCGAKIWMVIREVAPTITTDGLKDLSPVNPKPVV